MNGYKGGKREAHRAMSRWIREQARELKRLQGMV